jgi:ABC-type antimicrobial peptide transport system permease subunit
LTGEAGLDLYTPYLQWPPANVFYLVRTRVRSEALERAAVGAIRSVDPDQSTFDTLSMEGRIEQHLWRQRISSSLFLGFGGVALLLAAVGIHGVISQSVGQRTREIGVRMALGAAPRRVLGMVLGEALTLAGAGAAIGLGAAAALVRVLRHVLYGVSIADPAVYAAVLLVLGLVAAAAALFPAWRAARMDPLKALREAR